MAPRYLGRCLAIGLFVAASVAPATPILGPDNLRVGDTITVEHLFAPAALRVTSASGVDFITYCLESGLGRVRVLEVAYQPLPGQFWESQPMLTIIDQVCGDGTVNRPGETCDPPGTFIMPSGNTCRQNCTFCGDSILDVAAGEQCDPPGWSLPGGGVCRSDCTTTVAPFCGDGTVNQSMETCEPPGRNLPPFNNQCRADGRAAPAGVRSSQDLARWSSSSRTTPPPRRAATA